MRINTERQQFRLRSQQQGAALLIFTTILVLFFSTALLSGLSRVETSVARTERTNAALAAAKQSLIHFAQVSDRVAGSPGIGYLPCPDTNGDGISDSPCGANGESVEGWLPWQTLGGKPLEDGSGVCLRYAVSGNYKIDPATAVTGMPPTQGHFVIHGTGNRILTGNTSSDYALAVVFSPSVTVSGQNRGLGGGTVTRCGSTNANATINRATNYLDIFSGVNNAQGTYTGPGVPGSNALPTNTPSVFIQSEPQDSYNDKLIWITPTDFAAVYRRMP